MISNGYSVNSSTRLRIRITYIGEVNESITNTVKVNAHPFDLFTIRDLLAVIGKVLMLRQQLQDGFLCKSCLTTSCCRKVQNEM